PSPPAPPQPSTAGPPPARPLGGALVSSPAYRRTSATRRPSRWTPPTTGAAGYPTSGATSLRTAEQLILRHVQELGESPLVVHRRFLAARQVLGERPRVDARLTGHLSGRQPQVVHHLPERGVRRVRPAPSRAGRL